MTTKHNVLSAVGTSQPSTWLCLPPNDCLYVHCTMYTRVWACAIWIVYIDNRTMHFMCTSRTLCIKLKFIVIAIAALLIGTKYKLQILFFSLFPTLIGIYFCSFFPRIRLNSRSQNKTGHSVQVNFPFIFVPLPFKNALVYMNHEAESKEESTLITFILYEKIISFKLLYYFQNETRFFSHLSIIDIE